MLIVRTAGAARPGGRLRRKPKQADPGAPAEVPVTRITVTRTGRLAEGEAAAWAQGVLRDAERTQTEVSGSVALINRAIAAHRAASEDPLVPDVAATRALAIRIGHGSGEQLAESEWTEAHQLPAPPRSGRLDGVDPQTRVAAVLGGRDEVHPAETLLLRARLDLVAGRTREAALVMPEVARGLMGHPGAHEASADAVSALSEAQEGLERAAGEARSGAVSPEGREDLAAGVKAARALAGALGRLSARSGG